MKVIFHINKKYDSQESFFTLTKNTTHKGYISHQQKIRLTKVIFTLIYREYDS